MNNELNSVDLSIIYVLISVTPLIYHAFQPIISYLINGLHLITRFSCSIELYMISSH